MSEEFYVHYIFDITDQKLAEEALRESERNYREIFNSTKDAIFIHDILNGVIIDVNDSAVKMYGCVDKHELINANIGDISNTAAGYTQETAQTNIQNALATKSQTYEWYAKDKNGRPFWVEVSLKLAKIGKKERMLAVVRDIDERKQAEQKLADYTQELEQLYRYLDQEISKAQQVHAQILPQSLPSIGTISFAAYYQPAEKMGGDFYDLIHRDNKLIFYLSDVSGHGLDGAMLSLFVKHTINSYIDLTPVEAIKPKTVLTYLAEKYYQEALPEELYIAIFLAVLDLDSMELTYSAAGFQATPLVSLGTGEHLELVSKAFIISRLFPVDALNFNEASVKLSPGSTLFFTTDGLTEQGRNGTHFMGRLPDVFYANVHLPPELIKQAVVEDFRQFNNGSLQGRDDITFLVLQVAAEG